MTRIKSDAISTTSRIKLILHTRFWFGKVEGIDNLIEIDAEANYNEP